LEIQKNPSGLNLAQKKPDFPFLKEATGIRFSLSNFGNLAIPNIQDPRLSAP
jgi:hypothetical protein